MAHLNVCRLMRQLVHVSRAAVVRLVAVAALWPAVAVLSSVSAGAVEPVAIMYLDPLLPKAAVDRSFPAGLASLWIEALQLPGHELKRQAASAIAAAHPKGLTGLEAAIDPLMNLLQQPDQDRFTRLNVARALVVLDARQAAALLWEQLDTRDLDMAEVIEPALGRWGHPPMREVWVERLAGEVTLRRSHVLAIRGLTHLKATEALPRLLELAQDAEAGADVRLEAATALGQLQETGLLEPAKQLMSDKSPKRDAPATGRGADVGQPSRARHGSAAPRTGHRSADRHQGDCTRTIVPHRSGSHSAADRPDDFVRRRDGPQLGAQALVAKPTVPKLALLAPMMHDVDPQLRRYVCDALLELSKDPSLHEAVIDHGRQMLASEGWRGQEQAILLLVTLDDKTIVDRLLGLLAATRPEAHATAAWGLCQLQVPATADAILDVYTKTSESFLKGDAGRKGTYLQLSYLAQALGIMNVTAAEGVMRKYIPKNKRLHPTARSAAIWALGLLHAEQPDVQLADQFLERLVDIFNPMEPEEPEVARMSAVSLGRMKSAHTLTELQAMRQRLGLQHPIGYASAWAVQQISGEPIGELKPIVERQLDWFLTPRK